jgi:hypothetical protein
MRDEAGYDFARIAEDLGREGLRSPRGRRFYPKLVWSIYTKWKRRLAREVRATSTVLDKIKLTPLA